MPQGISRAYGKNARQNANCEARQNVICNVPTPDNQPLAAE